MPGTTLKTPSGMPASAASSAIRSVLSEASLPPDLVERHREVLAALQSRDPVVCEEAIRNHMAQKLADITH